MTANASLHWAHALTGDQAFQQEQARLGRVWTLLGVVHDVAKDGDWIRARLGGRSVFVQRFGNALRGFENLCAHRFHPLRIADRGNGPIVCGFHHWRYDQDGAATGIPICREIFGVSPRELGARLNRLEIATCGSLIFGRFPAAGATDGLDQFLGDGFPILATLCAMSGRPHRLKKSIDANWRLLIHVTLDDYHNVAVHHRRNYSRNDEIRYFRFGLHSAHFVGAAETLSSMAALCRENSYRPSAYRIFNVFPNVAISLFKATPYWYCYVQQFVPDAAEQSTQLGWFFRTGLPADGEGAIGRLTRPLTEITRARIVRYYINKIGNEDHRVCERLQSVAHQIDAWPRLGTQERRIEWFEESYARAVGTD
jgi:phenylpropionate dioxygenase-like ring-hydroxylating dioxygenase large terminal subunit